MANTGFDQSDFLQCCKFAEGDSRILMQKMARDRYKLFTKNIISDKEDSQTTIQNPDWDEETQI
jgi:hypothetical protein